MCLLRKTEPIYSSQFGFRKKHTITHAILHFTEKIGKQFDDAAFLLTFRRHLLLQHTI